MADKLPAVIVCTPCYGRMVAAAYMESVLKLQIACQRNGVDFGLLLKGSDALITRARAEFVAAFLSDPRGTHLLFIDADIAFEPEQVFRLLQFNADVVAAAYPAKQIDWQRIAGAVRDHRNPETAAMHYVLAPVGQGLTARNGFAEVRYAGNGFLLISRTALQRLCDAHPELKYRRVHYAAGDEMADNPHRYALFDTMIDPDTGEYLSEDFAFCRRWTDLGGKIWLDLRSKLTHFGQHAFVGDLSAALTKRDG
jgi:hypothetical protein